VKGGLGYVVTAYVFTAGVLGAYLLSLGRRHRSLRRRVDHLQPRETMADRPEEGTTNDQI
jgi:heme exporter protein CcmD